MKRFFLLAIFFSITCIPLVFWGGLYFVGGDDSRLYYLFPYEYFKNFTLQLISNNTLGTLGIYFSQSYLSGFSLFVYMMKSVFPFLNVQLLLFGLDLSLGFLFFYLFLGLFFPQDRQSFVIKLVASLFYIFSTFSIYTLWQSQLFVLYLVSTFPFLCYIFTAGFLRKNASYIIFGSVALSIFSSTLFSVPWFVALLISIIPIAVILFLQDKKTFSLLGAVFFITLVLLNFYWIFPFLYAPFSSDLRATDVVSRVGNQEFRNASDEVIRSVSKRNTLVYPFFGLFHKNIQEDFHWQTYSIFSQWNERLLYLNFIFLVPIALALFYLRKAYQGERRLYLTALISWLMILFLFTVKIGDWGTNLFIWLNNTIPGFVMFKNMYDKFGLAMAFSYAFLFAISLKMVFDNVSSARIKKYVLLFILGVILLNAKPLIFGDFYKTPLWTTEETYTSISDFNSDFYDLLAYLKRMDESSRFLWLPLNNANYIQVQDKNLENHYYSGVSPLQFLANKSDFNGKLSFPEKDSKIMFENIEKGNYKSVGGDLRRFNVKYVIVNHDISFDLQQSYLYGEKLYNAQMNDHFMNVILGEKIADFGEKYSLYKINNQYKNEKIYLTDNFNEFPDDFSQVEYRKLASYEYEVKIKNLNSRKNLVFLDPYHKQWEWYFTKDRKKFITGSHDIVFDYANGWTIDPAYIKQNFSKDQYHENPDGSIDLELTLYFKPQDYFYNGLMVSGITLAGCLVYLVFTWSRRHLKKYLSYN
jgi:hypothetical protein